MIPMTPMKALSIRQPMASWLLLPDGKDLDNRSRRTAYRGRLYIHSSARMTRLEYMEALAFVAIRGIKVPRPARDTPPLGVVLGYVDLVDCVDSSDSPWFTGPYGWVRANPVALPGPVRCKGKLGIWDLPASVEAVVREQLEEGDDHGRRVHHRDSRGDL